MELYYTVVVVAVVVGPFVRLECPSAPTDSPMCLLQVVFHIELNACSHSLVIFH